MSRNRNSGTSGLSLGVSERVSAVEADITHIDDRIHQLARTMEDGFSTLRNLVANQKQPLTAFAGWAAIVLSLVFAFGSPLKDADARLRERVDGLKSRELLDAETRGRYQERFETLHEEIESAITNRKDIDEKHLAAQESLDAKIAAVSHSLDNGLGRRIEELIEPLRVEIEWLKKQAEAKL